MPTPKTFKRIFLVLGGFFAVGLVGVLVLVGMMIYKQATVTPEERIAQGKKEEAMQAETDRLAESGMLENGVEIEGIPQLGSELPSLEGLDFVIPGEEPNSDLIPEGDASLVQDPAPLERSIVVNAEGEAQINGGSINEQDLAEYFSVWPSGTLVLLTVDPQCEVAQAQRWLQLCDEAGMVARFTSEEGDEIR